MEDASRVTEVHRPTHLQNHFDGMNDRAFRVRTAGPAARIPDHVQEREPLDALHEHQGLAVCAGDHIVDGHDIRVLQRAHDARFAQHRVATLVARGIPCRLDGHRPPQRMLDRLVDDARTSLTDELAYLEPTAPVRAPCSRFADDQAFIGAGHIESLVQRAQRLQQRSVAVRVHHPPLARADDTTLGQIREAATRRKAGSGAPLARVPLCARTSSGLLL